MAERSPLVNFLITHQPSLIEIDLVREIWMIPDRLIGSPQSDNRFTIVTDSPLYIGKLFVSDHQPNRFYTIDSFERVYDTNEAGKVYHVTASDTGIKYSANEQKALCSPQDSFTLKAGDIANFKGDKPIETTVGIFLANYLFLVYPFGDEIEYLNDEFFTNKLEKKIALKLIDGKISIDDVKAKYINALSLFGQATEIIAPGITEKSITIPKSIIDLRERLVKENKAALEAGDASVMSDIEQQLIAAYRKYLQDDPSLHFLLKAKYFNVTLKKLLLTQGMTEVFGSPGKFTFIDNPMGNGWKQNDLAAIFNEVRAGSFARAIETADGGVIAKLILRVLQDTRIDTADCGTTKGELVYATSDTLKDFVWNYIVGKNGKDIMITEENIPSLVGSVREIRTPGFCQATKGFCAKCFGHMVEQLGQKAFAPVANDFARNQTTAALKSMHGKSHAVVDVSDVNRYLTGN